MELFDNFNIIFNIRRNICLKKVILIAKHFIYVSRCKGNSITFKAFRQHLKYIYEIEKALALAKGKSKYMNGSGQMLLIYLLSYSLLVFSCKCKLYNSFD